MILQAANGKVICVDMIRPTPQRSAAELRKAILGEELNRVERAIEDGDLNGAWDMFKAAAKKIGNKGKEMLSHDKDKSKVHPAPHHDAPQEHHEGTPSAEETFSPAYAAELEKFYQLFDVFFKAAMAMWEKQAAPQTTSSDLVYYMIMPTKKISDH